MYLVKCTCGDQDDPHDRCFQHTHDDLRYAYLEGLVICAKLSTTKQEHDDEGFGNVSEKWTLVLPGEANEIEEQRQVIKWNEWIKELGQTESEI
ncbi:uncharacterized protein L201_004348 [Kwoniella dendrophila CBS 6074]|uniref:Uncharacterized protein n=1 Tax=Kwoniella dendrophila CBS 6074 TaxID=1295534 RepID=A0AAX4JX86_9TREE